MDEDNRADNFNQSLDDMLEDERRKDGVESLKLEEDGDSPASPPDDVEDPLPIDHQLYDGDLDQHEIYDEGRSNTANDSGGYSTRRSM